MNQRLPRTFLFLSLLFTTTIHAQNIAVKGTITTSDGKPASQVNVQLAEINQTVVTNAEGVYSFINILPGTYNMIVSYVGLVQQKKKQSR